MWSSSTEVAENALFGVGSAAIVASGVTTLGRGGILATKKALVASLRGQRGRPLELRAVCSSTMPGNGRACS